MTYETWCKHFTGIHNDTCKAGIKYNDVKVQDSRPLKLPCFKDQGCTDRCAFATFRTPEEVAAEEEKSTRILRTYLDNMARNICHVVQICSEYSCRFLLFCCNFLWCTKRSESTSISASLVFKARKL